MDSWNFLCEKNYKSQVFQCMASSMVCVTAVTDGQTLAKEMYEANVKQIERIMSARTTHDRPIIPSMRTTTWKRIPSTAWLCYWSTKEMSFCNASKISGPSQRSQAIHMVQTGRTIRTAKRWIINHDDQRKRKKNEAVQAEKKRRWKQNQKRGRNEWRQQESKLFDWNKFEFLSKPVEARMYQIDTNFFVF